MLSLLVVSVSAFVFLNVPLLFVVYIHKLVVGLMLLSVACIAWLSKWLAPRKSIRIASTVFVFGLWCAAVTNLLLTGGITSPAGLYLIVVCVFSALLLGMQAVVATLALTASVTSVIAIAQIRGYPLPHYFANRPLPAFVTFTLALTLSLIPFSFLVSELRRALAFAQQGLREREEAVDALRESEDRYRDLVEHSQDLICTHDMDGRILSVNEPPLKILGYSRTELMHKPLRDFVIPEMRPRCDEYLAAIQRDGSASGTLAVLTKDGQARLWEYHNTLRRDGTGAALVRGMAHDVTEQKEAEKALRLSEAKFSKAFAASPVEMAITTVAEGRLIEVNDAFERHMGFRRDEVIGHTTLEIGLWVHPSERSKVIAEIEQGCTITGREVELRTKAGEIRTKLYSTQPILIGREKCLLTACEDITARKKAETALRLSEERFAKAFRYSPSIASICTLDDGRFIDVNDAFERNSGYSRDEIIGHTSAELNLWCDSSERERVVHETRKSGSIRNAEFRFRTKDGTIVVLMTSIIGIDLEIDGINQKCLLAIGQDITARKSTEEALRASEDRFRLMADNIEEIFWQLDPTTFEVVYVSPAFETICERSVASVRASPSSYREIIHPSDARRIASQLRRLVATGEFTEKFRIMCPDNKVKWIEATGFTAKNSNGDVTALVGTAKDITGQNEFEEHLRRVQKMEALALLAGGVAHDFNNTLTGILGSAELALKSSGVSDGVRGRLQTIVKAALEARNLTGKLAYSQDEVIEKYPVNATSEVLQMQEMLKRVIEENIELVFRCRCEEKVLLASGLLYQIVLNLVVNAKDAMPRGGKLSISTDLVEIASQRSSAPGVPPGRYLRLEISDTGCGMSKEVRQRIFQPFFTTKSEGRGTGLGLFTVFKIVHQCAGHITVRSKPGKGSTFDIYFPIAESGVPVHLDTPSKPLRDASKTLVMVVEDDPRVRSMVHDQLIDLGYSVLCKERAIEAIADIREVSQQFDLVITDVVMPELNGPDLVQRLRQVKPDLKALYITGYANQDVLSNAALDAMTDLLHKPFTQEELGLKVGSLLGLYH